MLPLFEVWLAHSVFFLNHDLTVVNNPPIDKLIRLRVIYGKPANSFDLNKFSLFLFEEKVYLKARHISSLEVLKANQVKKSCFSLGDFFNSVSSLTLFLFRRLLFQLPCPALIWFTQSQMLWNELVFPNASQKIKIKNKNEKIFTLVLPEY